MSDSNRAGVYRMMHRDPDMVDSPVPFPGPHLELAVHADVITKSLVQIVIAKITDVLRATTRRQVLILVEVDGPRQEVEFIEPHFTWTRAAAKLLKETKIAYLITGRPMPVNAALIEDFARSRRVTLKYFTNRNRAVEWLQNHDFARASTESEAKKHTLRPRPDTTDAQRVGPAAV